MVSLNTMNKDEQVTHLRIDGIRISVELPPFFVYVDIGKGLNYYKTYVFEAIEQEKPVRNPGDYIREVLRQVADNEEERNNILINYQNYITPKRYEQQMDDAWFIFKKVREQKYFVRITDKNQKFDICDLEIGKGVIGDRLTNGESLMVEPIEFKEYE